MGCLARKPFIPKREDQYLKASFRKMIYYGVMLGLILFLLIDKGM